MSYPLLRSVGALCTCCLCNPLRQLDGIHGSSAQRGFGEAQKAKWENEWSEKVGVSLEYSFDSSGPDAWNPKGAPDRFLHHDGRALVMGAC